MSAFTPESKHRILLQYRPYTRDGSFEALARRYSVEGGKTTVRYWYSKWNGSAASLQRKAVKGRPRKLTKAQVNRHIKPKILAANRRAQAIHYPSLLPSVQAATGTSLSLRSLQRYGQQDLGVMKKHTKKRTAAESKCLKINIEFRGKCYSINSSS